MLALKGAQWQPKCSRAKLWRPAWQVSQGCTNCHQGDQCWRLGLANRNATLSLSSVGFLERSGCPRTSRCEESSCRGSLGAALPLLAPVDPAPGVRRAAAQGRRGRGEGPLGFPLAAAGGAAAAASRFQAAHGEGRGDAGARGRQAPPCPREPAHGGIQAAGRQRTWDKPSRGGGCCCCGRTASAARSRPPDALPRPGYVLGGLPLSSPPGRATPWRWDYGPGSSPPPGACSVLGPGSRCNCARGR